MITTYKSNPIFIAVEGPIGVGKTTLAQSISERYQFHLLKEIVEENPFLSKFYENIKEWSFQTEMYFLCNRYKQLEDVQQTKLNQGNSVVADYHIFKNLIFAGATLNDKQFDKYRKIYDILVSELPKPNLVIYIQASLPTLLKRIAIRGRSFEKNMDPEYLDQLCKDYEKIMKQFQSEHPEIPVLTFSGDELDYVANNQDLNLIFAQVEKALDVEWSQS